MKIELRGDSIRDVMTPEPVTVANTTTLEQAARHMRDAGIGNVIVLDGELITGILTDRDIVVRAVAEGWDPSRTPVGEVASRELTTITPDETIDAAVALMRDRSIRRLPVVESGDPSASCPWATSPSSATPTPAWGRSARRRPTTDGRRRGTTRALVRAARRRAAEMARSTRGVTAPPLTLRAGAHTVGRRAGGHPLNQSLPFSHRSPSCRPPNPFKSRSTYERGGAGGMTGQ